MLDMDAFNLVQISDLITENMINQGQLPYEARDKVCDALLRKHKHLYEKTKNKENGQMSRLPLIRSLAEIGRNHSSSKSRFCNFLVLTRCYYLNLIIREIIESVELFH